jgi:hypothetical protein
MAASQPKPRPLASRDARNRVLAGRTGGDSAQRVQRKLDDEFGHA